MHDAPDAARATAFPWRRLRHLLRPMAGGLTLMVALSTAGVLVGLAPPLALGTLVNALTERRDPAEAAILAVSIAIAIAIETAAYVLSDTMNARNASRMYRSLRVLMLDGLRRREVEDEEARGGLASRFISDAESSGVVISVLDSGSMLLVEFASALVVLGLLSPWTTAVVAPELLLTWVVTRRTQAPVATASRRRQEELEELARAVASETGVPSDARAAGRFARSADRLQSAESRLGWLQAVNFQGSGGLAKLGPIAAVVFAAIAGTHHVGTLIALYLLAQRVFWGFDGLVDLSLSLSGARGAVARCFALADAHGPAALGAATAHTQ